MLVRKAAERYTASNIAPRVSWWRLGCLLRSVVDHVFRYHTVLSVVVANVCLLILKQISQLVCTTTYLKKLFILLIETEQQTCPVQFG